MNNVTVPSLFKRLARHRAVRAFLSILALVSVIGGMSRADSTAIPAVSLASEPLYARGFRVKPTLTLALSVEFPTVGAAYLRTDGVTGSTDDAMYNVATAYVGYYDTEGCYTYDKTNRWFSRTGAASARTCGGSGFSGNFMNWSTSSAIDILRLALTGGDRVESLDTGSQTVLQRAVLPSNFFNSNNFPSKQITNAQALGAVPSALLSGYTGTVYVANCLNQIYFGTAKTGSCGAAGDNGKLLAFTITPLAASPIQTVGQYNSGACASENGTCTLSGGTTNVAYGANGSFYVKSFTGTSMSCNNATFGDPTPGIGKACFLASSASASLAPDPYFYSRVKVCDAAEAAVRTDLCQLYPNGNYKPVGNLQKYSDRIRVAVFGYLMDNAQSRNGGVLRAPMKYLGPKQYDSNFNLLATANPLQEWDSSTGVFIVNPNSDAMNVSGVINYTNHFGRTGTAQGTYKTYDPVSELYYEPLRYLQGLQPTPSAVSNVTAAMKDGFPIYDAWTDANPIVANLADYSCVKNNILTIGDVNTHGDRYLPGSAVNLPTWGDTPRAANPDGNEPNFYEWTNVVGAFERNDARSYLDGNGISRTTSNPMTPNAFFTGLLGDKVVSDYAGYYMAGMAYWANTHDIRAAGLASFSPNEVKGNPATYKNSRPGMRVTSYFIDVNENGSGTTLNGRKSNQFFLAAKYGGFSDDSATGNPFLDSKSAATNADWMSTASPGDPKTYFLGSNGLGMISALNNVFSAVAKQAGSIAGAAVSGSRIVSSGGVYQAKFDPTNWSGDVADYPITYNSTTGLVTIGDDTNPVWRATTTASTQGTLDNQAPDARNIFIGLSAPGGSLGAAVAFNWDDTNFEASTKTALRTPPYVNNGTQDPEATGRARVAYLRGSAADEGQGLGFRPRSGHKLGDIVNSGVVYSGAPNASITDAGYAAFYTANKNRTAAIYVGANDGMLHAFNATTGAELFAYIPSFVIPKLAALTSTSYVHTSYVDATPSVAEAQIGGSSGAWKTVLVSGAGAGAQGVFALDVTTPDSFSASSALWEFKDSDDADMGNVIGRPQILKVRTSAPSVSPAVYRWFAVVASGVNNYVADGHASTTGAPTLFLLDLAKAPGDAWALGTNYFKIAFPVGATTSANGMLGFSAVSGTYGEIGALYAGDLQGNLWKLNFAKANFSSSNSTQWSLNALSGFVDSSGSALPFFIATDGTTVSSAKRQPITVEPAIVYGPKNGYIVSFGTGRFLEQADLSTPFAQQSVYAVYDNGGSTPVGSSTDPGRGYLQAATVSGTTVSASAFVYGLPSSASATATRAGWYFNLPESTSAGERVISGFTYYGSKTLFSSLEPPVNGCQDGGGNQYTIDITTGAGSFTVSSVGLLGQPLVVKVGLDVLTDDSPTGEGVRTSKFQVFQQGSGGTGSGTSAPVTQTSASKRLSWRQLANPQ